MSKGAAQIPYTLPARGFLASGVFSVPLDQLPKYLYGLVMHVAKFCFHIPFTPTYSAGTGSVVGNNNIVSRCNLNDGTFNRFLGGFNTLRTKERMQTGCTEVPETDTNTASATQRNLRRVMTMFPANFTNSPSDGLLPCSLLQAAVIDSQFGANTDVDPNVTVLTSPGLRTVAWLVGLENELRIPPAYETRTWSATGADITIPGRAAYDFISLNKSTFAAFAAGEVGNVTLDLGRGPLISSVNAVDLGDGFVNDKAIGDIGSFNGEPGAASDLSNKNVNRVTPTALTSAENNVQPILWSPVSAKISKLYVSEGNSRLSWSGSQQSLIVTTGRILPQGKEVIEGYLSKSIEGLSSAKQVTEGKIKTIAKVAYKGRMQEFMPTSFKLS